MESGSKRDVKSIEISKVEAASRQIDSAILLFFKSGDEVAIHTLTCAAYNLIRDLLRKQGLPGTIIKDQIVTLTRPEYRKTWLRRINEAENFFKHADQDPDRILRFDSEITEMILFDACDSFLSLTGSMTRLMTIYKSWSMVHHFSLLSDEVQERMTSQNMPTLRSLDRLSFLNECEKSC